MGSAPREPMGTHHASDRRALPERLLAADQETHVRKALALGGAAAVLTGLAVTGAPAHACDSLIDTCTATTSLSFTLDAGTIAIAAQPAAVSPVQSLSAGQVALAMNLGLTTVTDTRLGSTGWTVSAAAGQMTAVGGTTIPASAMRFYVPAEPLKVINTSSTFTRGATEASAAVGSGVALVTSALSSAGPNTATYIPYVKVDVPSTATPGLLYSGVVTQTLA